MPPNRNAIIRVRDPISAVLWIFFYLYLIGIGAVIATVSGTFQFSPFLNNLLPFLGLPWNRFAERLPQFELFGFGTPFWLTLIAPAINLFVLYLLKLAAARRSAT
jgi:hypothetical protein